MVSMKTKGSFKNFDRFIKKITKKDYKNIIEKYARMGVNALADATPVDSGETANSWDYEIHYAKGKTKIIWTNSNVTSDGTPIAILLQYGHATKSGSFVQGLDFINPAIRPVFIDLANDIWKEVSSY